MYACEGQVSCGCWCEAAASKKRGKHLLRSRCHRQKRTGDALWPQRGADNEQAVHGNDGEEEHCSGDKVGITDSAAVWPAEKWAFRRIASAIAAVQNGCAGTQHGVRARGARSREAREVDAHVHGTAR